MKKESINWVRNRGITDFQDRGYLVYRLDISCLQLKGFYYVQNETISLYPS